MHALSGHRHREEDLQDRARHLAVRLPGMGLRRRVRGLGGQGHRPPRPRARGDALRHRGDLRLRPQRADPRRGPRRRPALDLPGHEDPAGDAGRAGGRAARRRQRRPAWRPPAGPVPGPPAEPGGARRHDHARHAGAAADRPGRRGRRQQLLAQALDRRGERARQPGADQPGPLQPGRPAARARPGAVRAGARPGHHRLQPAGAGAAVWPLRPGQPAGQPGQGQQRAVPAGEPDPGGGPDRCPARGRRGALGHAVAGRAGLADPQPGRGGDPRRVDRRAAGEQRRPPPRST